MNRISMKIFTLKKHYVEWFEYYRILGSGDSDSDVYILHKWFELAILMRMNYIFSDREDVEKN